MGRQRTSRRKTSATKKYKKSIRTKRRPRDIDQVQDDLKEEEENGQQKNFEYDDDLPGLGQHYCTPCARHFIDKQAFDSHLTQRSHKRRLQDVAQPQYSQEEADRAAGKTKEVLPPAHPRQS